MNGWFAMKHRVLQCIIVVLHGECAFSIHQNGHGCTVEGATDASVVPLPGKS